jgi:hypothetical protein
MKLDDMTVRFGGEGGIRTPGASEGTRDFESRRLNLTPEPLHAGQHLRLYRTSQAASDFRNSLQLSLRSSGRRTGRSRTRRAISLRCFGRRDERTRLPLSAFPSPQVISLYL